MNKALNKSSEIIAKAVFTVCAFVAIIAVFSITAYMIINGLPALLKVGIREILFGVDWKPTAQDPKFGILYIILTSIVGTAMAVIIGVPIGVLTAVFISDIAPKPLVKIVQPAVELLAGIPSVVFGLLGLMVLNPFMYKIEQFIFKNDSTHQFTGGANLISAVLVLVIMVLPNIINITCSSLNSVPSKYKEASAGLGATKIQTIFKVEILAARSGIIAAIVLGIGRAIGEAMAISLVSGSSVNLPLPFNSVRFLTTAIVSEMGYAADIHRQVLFTIGLILFIFIMIINICVTKVLKRSDK